MIYLQIMNIYVESCANSSYRTVCSVLRRDVDREGCCGRCIFSDLNPNNVCHDIIVLFALSLFTKYTLTGSHVTAGDTGVPCVLYTDTEC